jgi:VWFA-related protein
MPVKIPSLFRKGFAVLLCLGALFSATRAQQNPSRTQGQTDEVIRISTELVQTDVTVVDKEGRFVDGLKPEQFQLFVDGKQQAVSFFERVSAGSASEEVQLAVARGKGASSDKAMVINPLDRGRLIIFLADDLHMSPDSLNRTRKTIAQFIEREMGQNDQAAITSASGQVGFLQQLTNNKAVLLRAVERLKNSLQSQGDMEFPPMSEIQALAIQVQNDEEMLNFFMEPLIRTGVPPRNAETMVRTRSRQILTQSYHFARNTLDSLSNLAHTSGQLPGRKLVFFISERASPTPPSYLLKVCRPVNTSCRSQSLTASPRSAHRNAPVSRSRKQKKKGER